MGEPTPTGAPMVTLQQFEQKQMQMKGLVDTEVNRESFRDALTELLMPVAESLVENMPSMDWFNPVADVLNAISPGWYTRWPDERMNVVDKMVRVIKEIEIDRVRSQKSLSAASAEVDKALEELRCFRLVFDKNEEVTALRDLARQVVRAAGVSLTENETVGADRAMAALRVVQKRNARKTEKAEELCNRLVAASGTVTGEVKDGKFVYIVPTLDDAFRALESMRLERAQLRAMVHEASKALSLIGLHDNHTPEMEP